MLLSNITDILSLSSFQGNRVARLTQGQILMQKGKDFVNPIPTANPLTSQSFSLFICEVATGCSTTNDGRKLDGKHSFSFFV